jgi:hypothetical protein
MPIKQFSTVARFVKATQDRIEFQDGWIFCLPDSSTVNFRTSLRGGRNLVPLGHHSLQHFLELPGSGKLPNRWRDEPPSFSHHRSLR